MTWIPSRLERTISFSAPLSRVFSILVDVERSGGLFPGVSRIEKQGDGLYRFILEERSSAGLKFHGDYVVKYTHNGADEVHWMPVSGNVRSSGSWKLHSSGEVVVGQVVFESDVDAPIPSLLRSVIRGFAQNETTRGVDIYLALLKKMIEQAS